MKRQRPPSSSTPTTLATVRTRSQTAAFHLTALLPELCNALLFPAIDPVSLARLCGTCHLFHRVLTAPLTGLLWLPLDWKVNHQQRALLLDVVNTHFRPTGLFTRMSGNVADVIKMDCELEYDWDENDVRFVSEVSFHFSIQWDLDFVDRHDNTLPRHSMLGFAEGRAFPTTPWTSGYDTPSASAIAGFLSAVHACHVFRLDAPAIVGFPSAVFEALIIARYACERSVATLERHLSVIVFRNPSIDDFAGWMEETSAMRGAVARDRDELLRCEKAVLAFCGCGGGSTDPFSDSSDSSSSFS